jgi:hypothetical protein
MGYHNVREYIRRRKQREGERVTTENHRAGDERVVVFVLPEHTTKMGS